MKSVSKVGVALLAGLAAGAFAGVLLAPDEGEKTRKKLAKKARKMEDKLKEKATNIKDKARDWKGKADDYAGKANHVKDDTIKTAEGYL